MSRSDDSSVTWCMRLLASEKQVTTGGLPEPSFKFIENRIIPIVLRHAISGTAHINTEDELLDNPVALAMLIDVFSERGYHAGVDIHRIEIPDHLELATGKLTCRTKKVYRIEIRFQGSEIRRG